MERALLAPPTAPKQTRLTSANRITHHPSLRDRLPKAKKMIAKDSLRSDLFRRLPRLQACLVDDASHIPPGSKGSHVLRIQQALTMLGQVPTISWTAFERETAKEWYGPETVKTVLLYKTKRRIINRSYQTQADNIVGKMTIRALDDEMVAYERVKRFR